MGGRPDSFSVGLDTLHRINDADCSIQDWQTTVNLETKVLMSRCVNKIDGLWVSLGWAIPLKWPVKSNGSRLNCDATLPLKIEEVRDGISSIDIFSGSATEVQQAQVVTWV